MSKTQPVTAPTAAVAATSAIPQAPPFFAPWQTYRNPAANPAGFWTAVRHFPWTGGFVMQLGAAEHPSTAPLTKTIFQVGYQWEGFLDAGWNSITSRQQLNSVTLLPRGGQISARLLLHLRGPLEERPINQRTFSAAAVAVSGQVVYLQINADLEQPGTYRLRVVGELNSQYQGSAMPYGEIICDRTEVYHSQGFQAVSAAKGVAAGSQEIEEGEPLLGKLPLEEIAKSRLIGPYGEPIL